MKEEEAEKALELTLESYKRISKPFSDTRNSVWSDCKAFEAVVKAGDSVLDVGCGNGKIVPWLKERGVASCVGIDANPNFIQIARERHEGANTHFFDGDLRRLDAIEGVGGQTFDSVFCVAVLHHLPSQRMRATALAQMRARLAEGGSLCMTNWNLFQIVRDSKSVLKGGLRRDLLTRWKGGDVEEILYYYAFTPRELSRLCREAGFRESRSWYSSYGMRRHWWDGRNIMTIAYA